ncbi:MAG: hypothetical protein ACM3XZ_08215 [Betaproteobacteria bacterium]
MAVYDRDARVRILLADAYDTLARRGIITWEQAEAAKELVDRLEDFTPEDLERRLGELFPPRPTEAQGLGPGGVGTTP